MKARVEVTKRYAQAYADAPKQGKSLILDQVVEVTGWNRDHARQQLRLRLLQAPGRATATVAVIDRRKTKPRRYSYDATKVLQQVWATSGGSCGKYLAAAMGDWLDAMEAEGSLVPGVEHYRDGVRAELESLSRFLCKGSSCCCSNLEVAVDAFGVDEGELGQSLFPVRHDLSLDEPAGGLAFAGGLAGFLGAVTSAFVLDGADR